jgi:transposase
LEIGQQHLQQTAVVFEIVLCEYLQRNQEQNVPEIMIIITDGISENQTATTSEAKTAKLKGIKIIVVGIGNGVDKTELQTISSDPSSKFMINVNSYGKLDTIMDNRQ